MRILVPLDGSVEAECVLAEVERVGVGTADVHLLHVHPSRSTTVGLSPETLELRDYALAYLENARRSLPETGGLDLIRAGDPADAISQVALELNIDLIAMCTRSRTRFARWLLGNAAQTVVYQTQLPVLLVRTGIPAPRPVLRRVLVPLDGTEDSFAILTAVKRLALRTGAEVVLLHVTDRAIATDGQRGRLDASGMAQDSERKLLAIDDRLDESELDFWQMIAEGDPVEEILNQACTLEADVIAMSTHARSGRDRTVFGSVAQDVLERTDRAVLLQRPVVRTVATTAWRGL